MDKVETLKRYKFSLAFENSNEEDYVTEKFFQSLVAGMGTCSLSTSVLHLLLPNTIMCLCLSLQLCRIFFYRDLYSDNEY